MNLEELTKSQIILLTLLVSFVTSIATGIVTVSLMEQAPPAIAQTVNRVVERTVERVVPASQGAAAVITTEKTVIVKESELLAEAIARAEPSVVRIIREEVNREQETIDTFLTLGVVVDESGIVLAESLRDTTGLIAIRSDGERARLLFSSKNDDTGIITLTAATSSGEVEGGEALSWDALPISGEQLALGASVVALSMKDTFRIGQGIVTEATSPFLNTDIAADLIIAGTPLIDRDGMLVGISTTASRAHAESAFLSASLLVADSPAEGAEGKPAH